MKYAIWYFVDTWILMALVALSGCVPPSPPPPVPKPLAQEIPFAQAVHALADNLVAQILSKDMPENRSRVDDILRQVMKPQPPEKRGIIIDPMIDARTYEQTALTKLVEKRVTERLAAAHEQFQVLPFVITSFAAARYLLTGTITRAVDSQSRTGWQITMALTEMKSNLIIAQASVLALEEGLDATPTAFFRDSPVILRDSVVDGYVQTTSTTPGKRADLRYLSSLTTAPQTEAATNHYNDGNYQAALEGYKKVAAMTGTTQSRPPGGVYVSAQKLKSAGDAENAFSKLVTIGIEGNHLSVKFLFKPGTTDFWPDTGNSEYNMWLRQIATTASTARVCLNIIGHTTRTGTLEYNKKLSTDRAEYVKQRLEKEAADLKGRLRPIGKWFSDPIVGIGTDDARDAVDRRVQFEVITCAAT